MSAESWFNASQGSRRLTFRFATTNCLGVVVSVVLMLPWQLQSGVKGQRRTIFLLPDFFFFFRTSGRVLPEANTKRTLRITWTTINRNTQIQISDETWWLCIFFIGDLLFFAMCFTCLFVPPFATARWTSQRSITGTCITWNNYDFSQWLSILPWKFIMLLILKSVSFVHLVPLPLCLSGFVLSPMALTVVVNEAFFWSGISWGFTLHLHCTH